VPGCDHLAPDEAVPRGGGVSQATPFCGTVYSFASPSLDNTTYPATRRERLSGQNAVAFNSATVSPPWRTRRSETKELTAVVLQWSHESVFVEKGYAGPSLAQERPWYTVLAYPPALAELRKGACCVFEVVYVASSEVSRRNVYDSSKLQKRWPSESPAGTMRAIELRVLDASLV
jgi:hypothetical protein